jgi:addiction module HigA family antidote
MTLRLWITIERKHMSKSSPVTPGELLSEEFLEPMGITQYRLAKEIGVPPQRIGDIVAGKRAITAETDLRLCRYFGLSNGYWLRAQAAHDTEVAERRIGSKLSSIKPWSLAVRESATPYRVRSTRKARR